MRTSLSVAMLVAAAAPTVPVLGQIKVEAGRRVDGSAGRPCRASGHVVLDDGTALSRAKGGATGMVVENCTLTAGQMGVSLHDKANPVDRFTLRNSRITLRRPLPAAAIPEGTHAKWGTNILFENVEASGFRTLVPPENRPPLCGREEGQARCIYPNGDGFASEFARGLTYRRTYSHDNANGCYDDKAHFILYDDVVAERCDYGIRAWWRGPGNFRATTLTVRDVRKAVVQLMNGGDRATEIGNADMTIEHLVVDNATEVTPIVEAEPGTSITIGRCTIRMPLAKGATQAFGGTKAKRKLGPGCMDAAGNVILAGDRPTIGAAR